LNAKEDRLKLPSAEQEKVAFTYSYEIRESKIDLVDILAKNAGGGSDEENQANSSGKENPSAGGMGNFLKDAISQAMGDEILKFARVEVFWPEGAVENSVDLAMLLPNMRKLDEVIASLKPLKSEKPAKPAKPEDPPPPIRDPGIDDSGGGGE
jgi:hypothetical protein